ncbi:MAG: T9SS type A sorting domain-containing protein [Bacteroidetes bacterium]|nr:T9SS type A sorting domain-containing protein [Bacteroidota bacterium]
MKTHYSSRLATSLAKSFSFLFFSLLYFQTIAQPDVPCGDISLQACGTDVEVDCYTTRQTFYFAYVGMTTPAPTYFSPSEITVTFTINITGGSGDAYFDHSRCATDILGVYNNSNGATHSLLFHGACSSFTVNLDDDCNSPSTFDLYIISDPGVTYTVSSDLETKYDSPGNPCSSTCHANNFASHPSTGTLGISAPASCSDLALVFTVEGASSSYTPSSGVFTVDPHEEVTVRLGIRNNGGSSVTLDDIDLLLSLDDINGTLPTVTDWVNYFVENTSTQNDPDYELHDAVNGTHYFHFGSVGNSGVIAASSQLEILAFSVKPPEGLDNILGELGIAVEYLRITDDNNDCCQPSSTSCTVEFPGDLPCSGSPLVSLSFEELTGLDDCQSGFAIHVDIDGASSVTLTDLHLVVSALTTGNLGVGMTTLVAPAGVTKTVSNPVSGCPVGLSGPCNTYEATFDLPTGTVTLYDDANMFKVIFEGYDGTTIEAIDLLSAMIQISGSSACIPEVDEASALSFLPLENECTYCYDSYIKIDEYDSHNFPALEDCEAGFTVHALKSPSVQSWESFVVELTVQNPNNLTLSVIPPAIMSVSGYGNTCTPTSTITGNTIHFQYCPATPIPGNNADIPLFSVVFDGEGCVTDPQFTMATQFDLSSSAACYPEDVTVIDPLVFCSPCQTYTIGGIIAKENGEGVDIEALESGGYYTSGIFIIGEASEDADCYVVYPDPPSAPTGGCNQVTETTNIGDCSGQYTVEIDNDGCSTHDHFSITPYKNSDNHLNGVSTYDLVLISKHVLGTTYLDSPYKIIAADINRSNTVSTYDIVEIRKVILQINTSYPNNTSWRFVPKDYVFPNPANPFSPLFPECAKLDFSGANDKDQIASFVAIKIGDVNGNAMCNAFVGNLAEYRSVKWEMSMAASTNSTVKEGEDVVIDFFLSGPTALSAWQAGIKFDPIALQFEEALPSELDGMNIGNFGLTEADQGNIRALWYDRFGGSVPYTSQVKLFSLRFKALQPIRDLASLFQLDDEILQTVAYEEDGNPGGIQLSYSADVAALTTIDPAIAMKVTSSPNPFYDKLSLFVQVKEATYLDVLVFDALGRVVASQSEYREPGEHEIQFDRTEHWGSGVFTWQVKTDKQTLAGKVVKK